jgi:large subunit ribosomal protein L21
VRAGGSSSTSRSCETFGAPTALRGPSGRGYTLPLVYAVIRTGGKQQKVTEGETLSVELLRAGAGEEVELSPVLLVDGADVVSSPERLASARVSARVVGETRGPKIHGFTYKPKTRGRKAWGHRQHYTTIEITRISREG